MDTLLLDQTTWDLLTDSSGNIAKATVPYAMAQDVASACKNFLGELWYDTTQGIPYFDDILGQFPSMELLKQYLVDQALTVPGVASAICIIQTLANRQVTGQIQFTDANGTVTNVSLF